MSIKRSIWAVPVTAVILFGLILALMVYLNLRSSTARVQYPLLAQLNALIQDVDTISNGFAAPGGSERSMEALTAQAQQTRLHLRALGAMPGQTAQAGRLSQAFEAWYRPAMQARLMQALQDDPIAFSEDIGRQYAILQISLEDARLLALRSFADSALEDNGRVKHMLEVSIAVVLLLIALLGRLAWVSMRGEERQSDTATPDRASHADSQQRALSLLQTLNGRVDTLRDEARTLVADRRDSARSRP